MITDVDGIRAGHWTGAGSGVTVVLAPAGTIGSGEVRGSSPATRETDLLAPGRLVERVDAVVLTGGSAFGLASADGVVRWLEERGQGYPTSGGPVPIVVAAAVFDLGRAAGDRPGPDAGYAAAAAAERDEPVTTGAVGAGRNATVGKWQGAEHATAGGVGTASAPGPNGSTVGVLAVVNAVGSIVGADGTVMSGPGPESSSSFPDPRPFENTTLVVVATDARLDRTACFLLAQAGHDGMTQALRPAHTRFDGDAVFTLATGRGPALDVAELERLRAAAADTVATAIRSCTPTR